MKVSWQQTAYSIEFLLKLSPRNHKIVSDRPNFLKLDYEESLRQFWKSDVSFFDELLSMLLFFAKKSCFKKKYTIEEFF